MKTLVAGHWLPIADGDPRGAGLYRRHYSRKRYREGRRSAMFVGPGEKLVLMTQGSDALFVWKRERFTKNGQEGVNCSIFRNESQVRSSDLIREACELAWVRWPGQRLYTYVNANRIQSTNPGYCFIKAGWQRYGMTKGGLHILEVMR